MCHQLHQCQVVFLDIVMLPTLVLHVQTVYLFLDASLDASNAFVSFDVSGILCVCPTNSCVSVVLDCSICSTFFLQSATPATGIFKSSYTICWLRTHSSLHMPFCFFLGCIFGWFATVFLCFCVVCALTHCTARYHPCPSTLPQIEAHQSASVC